MSEHRIKQDINLFEIVDEYTKRISRVIDEQTLANVENQLAEYGYVKVVRCRDCKWFSYITEPPECYRVQGCMIVEPDDFCAWGKRKDGGDD